MVTKLARHEDVVQEGVSYGSDSNTDAKEVVPYCGLTYQIQDDVMLYASYSEVFKQQIFVNSDLQPLGVALGDSSEIGLKKSFNDGLAVFNFALFQSSHSNLGEFDKRNEDGIAVYDAKEYGSDGYEFEFSGEVAEGFNIAAGYTRVDVENSDGNDVRPYVPENLVKFSASYSLPALPALKLGGVLQWQDQIRTDGIAYEIESITELDLAIHYKFNDNFSVALLIDNATDEKHLNSLYWDQAYYAAPRNLKASVSWSL